MKSYETLIPRKFVLDSGELVCLNANDVTSTNTPLFLLYTPEKPKILYRYLKAKGFEDAKPSKYKRELFSVRKPIDKVWELHIRIYRNGFLEGEVEVRREYLEHLSKRRSFVVYEIYEWTKDLCSDLYIFYKPRRRWIVRIIDNFVVRLDPPSVLTPWKPIAVGVSALLLTILRKLRII